MFRVKPCHLYAMCRRSRSLQLSGTEQRLGSSMVFSVSLAGSIRSRTDSRTAVVGWNFQRKHLVGAAACPEELYGDGNELTVVPLTTSRSTYAWGRLRSTSQPSPFMGLATTVTLSLCSAHTLWTAIWQSRAQAHPEGNPSLDDIYAVEISDRFRCMHIHARPFGKTRSMSFRLGFRSPHSSTGPHVGHRIVTCRQSHRLLTYKNTQR
ncbi:hypothetical protein EDD15DRAFT_1287643 [Pisolithus albus]|nr:hypothetical protein EDD15DRAFT_1287643 [Pisolithus albus]